MKYYMRCGMARRLTMFIATCTLSAATCTALCAQPQAGNDDAMTLEDALVEAHRANAELPAAQFATQQALARARAAHGALYPSVSIDGDVHGGTPQSYASNDAMARVLLQTPIYTGGELQAGIARSNAEADSSEAAYRISVRDIDLAVRTTYSRILMDDAMRDFNQRAITRLAAYLMVVRARQSVGQGVAGDVLRTQQRVAGAEADLAAANQDLNQARMAFNDLLGRVPNSTLSLAALPEPTPPAQSDTQPWLTTPDVEQSEANVRASEANLQAVQAGRKPHVTLQADVGHQWSGDASPAPLNGGRGSGGQVTLNFSLPLWDNGVFHARMDEAHAALNEAQQRKVIAERAAQFAWTQAVGGVRDLYAEYRARNETAATARDAYLQAESIYRGGQGTSLEVLDAYDAWTQANQSLLGVIYRYRVAQANLYRWGTP